MPRSHEDQVFDIVPCAWDDFPEIRALVDASEGLDKHTDYTYWVALHEWGDFFLVARQQKKIAGFVFGVRSFAQPERIFLWQVGVLSAFRRQGIALALVTEFMRRAGAAGANQIWLTISDNLEPSKRLFETVAGRVNAILQCEGETQGMGGLLAPESIYVLDIPQPSGT